MSGLPSEQALDEEFDRVMATKGGLLLLDHPVMRDALARMSFVCTVILQSHPVRNPLRIGYVANFGVGACACTKDGNDYIGIYAGTIPVLLHVFNNLMSHPDLLSEIGDVSMESAPPTVPDLFKAHSDAHNSAQMRFPKDPDRARHAANLFNCAMDFLVLHELTHLRNGHCDYLCVRNGGALLIEDQVDLSHGEPALPHLSMQALEMDADACGACYTLNLAYGPHPDKSDISNELYSFSNREMATKSVILATTMLFRMFDEYWTPDRLLQRTHPPAAVRSAMITATLHEHTRKPAHFIDGDVFTRATSHGVAECLRGIRLLRGRPDYGDTFRHAFDEATRDHVSRILGRWTELRPELSPYSRRGPLPI